LFQNCDETKTLVVTLFSNNRRARHVMMNGCV
jgi:hypothetical protein